MVRGIKESKLLSDLLEGQDSNVPVGRTILTNTRENNSKETKSPFDGKPLTNLHVDQFDAFGKSRQDRATKRNEDTSDVAFSDRAVINDGLIVESAFDNEGGVINFVRTNGQVFDVDGLLTQADFGRGATGPKGDPGFDAYGGDDGEEGPEGDTGCEGAEGKDGELGPPGKDGEDGPTGIQGPGGQPGPPGPMGPFGPLGREGHEGARGPRGLSCLSDSGSAGPDGASINPNVVISATEPSGNVVLWGIPE